MKISKYHIILIFARLGLALGCSESTDSASPSTTYPMTSNLQSSSSGINQPSSSTINQQPVGVIVFPINNYCTSGFSLVISGSAADDGAIPMRWCGYKIN